MKGVTSDSGKARRSRHRILLRLHDLLPTAWCEAEQSAPGCLQHPDSLAEQLRLPHPQPSPTCPQPAPRSLPPQVPPSRGSPSPPGLQPRFPSPQHAPVPGRSTVTHRARLLHLTGPLTEISLSTISQGSCSQAKLERS